MTQLVLACDLGTGGLKGAVLAPDGRILAEASAGYRTLYPGPSLHEQRPADWWTALASASRALVAQGAQGRFDAADIRAVSLSGHSLGCVPVDGDGSVLQDAVPIWSDGRAAETARLFFERTDEAAWYLQTGNGFPAPLYTLFKILWLREHRPEVFARARRVLGTKDVLNLRMTGRMATDPSYASGLGAYDLARGRYDEALLKAAGLSPALLPEIVPSASVVGALLPKAAEAMGLSPGTAVVAGGVDNSCMALGARTFREGDLFSAMGSSSWLTVSAARPLLDVELRSYAFAHVVPGQFISATSIFSSGTTTDWMGRQLLGEAEGHAALEALAQASPPGARGLLMVPTLGGGTSLEGGAEVRGALLGLSLGHTRADLARAGYEGVAYGLRVALDALRSMTPVGGELLAVGGGAKSAFWRAILADILDVEVVKTSVDQDAAVLGAAALAFRALGAWPDFEPVCAIHRIEARHAPRPQTRAAHAAGLAAYRLAAGQQRALADALAACRRTA